MLEIWLHIKLQNIRLYQFTEIIGCHTRSRAKILNILISAAETQDQMKSGLFLDVVIRQGPTVFKLLSGEDQPLLVRGDALLVLIVKEFQKKLQDQ